MGHFYDKVIITKPYLSRPANSEKYIIATGFKGIQDNNQKLYKIIYNLIEKWDDNMDLNEIINVDIPKDFMNAIVNYNVYNTKKQIYSLLTAFEFIELYTKNKNILEKQIQFQLEIAISWCKKYDIPIRNILF
jgi:hypothetical protein